MPRIFVAFIFSLVCTSAVASIRIIEAVPSGWKLENYVNSDSGTVVVWYTGSACNGGRATLVGTDVSQKDRFWAVIMAGMVKSKKVFVYYDDSTSDCNITSFGLQN